MVPDYIYETILDETISTHKPAQVVDVAGFREFALMVRLKGTASATVRMEVNFDNSLVVQENLELDQDGMLHFTKSYTVFAPSLAVVLYHPSSPMKVRMTVYAGH